MDFPYPLRFISSDGKQFKVRITKINRHSWWLKILDGDIEVKLIKIQKRSPKLIYHDDKGGETNGKAIFNEIKQKLGKQQSHSRRYGQASGVNKTH